MLKLALKSLRANALRLGLTAFAIILGVGFIVSSFVLRDGLKESFGSLSKEIVAGTDLGASAPDGAAIFTAEDLEAVRTLDDVRAAEPVVINVETNINSIQPIKADGTVIETQGQPPQIAFNWADDDVLRNSTIEQGRAPTKEGEWVLDSGAAAKHKFNVGTTYTLSTPSGNKSAELVGTFRFGPDNITNGATLMGFSLDTVQDYLQQTKDGQDRYNEIIISADANVEIEDLRITVQETLDASQSAVGTQIEVKNETDIINEQAEEFNFFIDIIGYALLGFALLALFVSIFIIANTFAIVISQRTRELGLLRAVGATPGQIRLSVLVESLFVGLIGSAIGLAAGVGIALGLKEIFPALDFQLPDFPIVLTPFTISVALSAGTVVTVLSAFAPAFNASRISPVTAISGINPDAEKKQTLRLIIGGVITALGIIIMLVGLFGGSSVLAIVVPLAVGAAIAFIGVTLLSPLAAGPLSRFLGKPLEILFGTAGALAKQNAARNPQRTASTASALMIGLAFVSLAAVFSSSFKTDLTEKFDSKVKADYVIRNDTAELTISAEVSEKLKANDSFEVVVPFSFGDTFLLPTEGADETKIDDGLYETIVMPLDPKTTDGILNLDVTEGSLTALDENTIAIQKSVAEDLNVGLGDTVTISLTDGATEELDIMAIHDEGQIGGNFTITPLVVTPERFATIADTNLAYSIAMTKSPAVSVEQANADFEAFAKEYPTAIFESSAEYQESIAGEIDQFFGTLTVLLALAMFIALLGIANTLTLSIFERKREIGLLRAVGMTKRQTRRMIRWEAAIISAVGAIFGAVIGIALGALLVKAIPDKFLSSFSIPWGLLAILVLLASAAGLLAALFSSFKGSRVNVLDAISDL